MANTSKTMRTDDDRLLTNTVKVANQVVDKITKDPQNDVSNASAVEIKNAVTKEVSAVVINQTNQEPWYQSRVIIGTGITVLASIAGLAGYSVAPEDAAALTQLVISGVTLVSGAFALYGRIFAKKPIGS